MCDTSTLPKQIFKIIIAVCNDYLPFITLFFYALIIIKLRIDFSTCFKSGKITPVLPASRKRFRQDAVIFLQALTTCACFSFKFRVLDTVGYGETELSLTLKCLIYVSIYVRDTTQAVYMLFFNQCVKGVALEILCKERRKTKVVVLH